MRISTKGRYGLTIMIALARSFGKGPLPLKKIAEEHDLSFHYLEQLATPLRNAELIRSIRGAYGGYELAKEPAAITTADILHVLEGPIMLVEGIEQEEPMQQALWLRATEAVKNVLQSTTLEDLLADQEHRSDPYMFYI